MSTPYSEGYWELLEWSVGVLLSLLKHGGMDKGAEVEAEMDRPWTSHAHACISACT